MLQEIEVKGMLGTVWIRGDDALISGVSFHRNLRPAEVSAPLLREAARQMEAYLEGRLRRFDLPLEVIGTPYQCEVWSLLERIPYGRTVSYKDLAQQLAGSSPRAVGTACGANRLPILIPCHRVVAGSGALTGFVGGLGWKQALLGLEKGSIPLFAQEATLQA